MPEEINRVLTDAIADLLLVSEPSGCEHLSREGIAESRIRLVGNVMIDTLVAHLSIARDRQMAARLGLDGRRYGFVTLHRPSNVDDPATLARLLGVLRDLAETLPLVFAMHPRTAAAATQMGLAAWVEGGRTDLICVGPQPYLDSLSLLAGASVVLTDSGGLQEESSVLGVPCLTLRENTERPVTVSLGTSRLVGNDPARITEAFHDAISGRWQKAAAIPLWDGRAGQRVAAELVAWIDALAASGAANHGSNDHVNTTRSTARA
jgi:UDP-N-acetylglucosamine 2-epimerase (non-hydrolysing)